MAGAPNAETLGADRSVTELLREMREKAEAEREQIVDAARRRAAEIEEQNKRECERLELEGLAQVERELSAERNRVVGAVREEVRAGRVALKRAEIDRVFEAARKTLETRVGGPGWETALSALLDEALMFVGAGATIVVANEDLSICRKWNDANASKATVTGGPNPRGCVVATSADGKRHARNDLLSRLRRVRVSGLPEIARILFGER